MRTGFMFAKKHITFLKGRNARLAEFVKTHTISEAAIFFKLSKGRTGQLLRGMGIKAVSPYAGSREWMFDAERLAPTHSYSQLMKATGQGRDRLAQYLSKKGIKIGIRSNGRKRGSTGPTGRSIEIMRLIADRGDASMTDIANRAGVSKEITSKIAFFGRKCGFLNASNRRLVRSV